MKYAIILMTIATLADHASGQLITHNGFLYPTGISVQTASKVPMKLQGDASLAFDTLQIIFDGGSHCADFDRHDGGKLKLFFPHSGYWTPSARKDRKQPIAVLTSRNGKQMLVEIKTDSKLNQRIVDLIDVDISTGNYLPEKIATLKRIRDSVRERTPLKEIADRMDIKTGEFKFYNDPFDFDNLID